MYKLFVKCEQRPAGYVDQEEPIFSMDPSASELPGRKICDHLHNLMVGVVTHSCRGLDKIDNNMDCGPVARRPNNSKPVL